MSPELIGKDALLALAREERAALEAALDQLADERMTAPDLPGGRSPKDVLAHLTAWERRVLTALNIGRTGETPAWPEPGYNPWDTDKLNQRDFEANRDRPLADVRSESQATHAEFIALVESFSADEIANDLPYTPGIKLEQILRGHADEHYREHRGAIEAALGGGT